MLALFSKVKLFYQARIKALLLFASPQRGILFCDHCFLTLWCDFWEGNITAFDTKDNKVFNTLNEQMVFYGQWRNRVGIIQGLNSAFCSTSINVAQSPPLSAPFTLVGMNVFLVLLEGVLCMEMPLAECIIKSHDNNFRVWSGLQMFLGSSGPVPAWPLGNPVLPAACLLVRQPTCLGPWLTWIRLCLSWNFVFFPLLCALPIY